MVADSFVSKKSAEVAVLNKPPDKYISKSCARVLPQHEYPLPDTSALIDAFLLSRFLNDENVA